MKIESPIITEIANLGTSGFVVTSGTTMGLMVDTLERLPIIQFHQTGITSDYTFANAVPQNYVIDTIFIRNTTVYDVFVDITMFGGIADVFKAVPLINGVGFIIRPYNFNFSPTAEDIEIASANWNGASVDIYITLTRSIL